MEELQKKIQKLIKNEPNENFIFELLYIFGNTKTTIKRLRDGDKNKIKEKGELELRSKLFFKVVDSELYSIIDDIKSKLKGKRADPRFIIVTDYKTLLAYDTKTKDTLDIKISELGKKYNFFLPWLGIEKTEYLDENIADVKAAQNLAKLYNEIIKTNHHKLEQDVNDLNIFLSRLLFCYFSEDTGIFSKNQFTHTLGSYTNDNGEDTKSMLKAIFAIFNQKEIERKDDQPDYLNNFPYVNGKLFSEDYFIPSFTAKSRRILLDMGGLDWSQINPDIFGSMMQAVVSSDNRSNFGMHYTSVPNIMKLIKPLFLDELHEEFEKCIGSVKKLEALKNRLSKIKFFDPACGSGNFLIIAYKEIKKLEIEIIKELNSFALSDINLSQFYGIEIDNFACETAKLSMYLAEHQMNVLFLEKIGLHIDPLPLKDGGNIVQGNASRTDWGEVCLREEDDEIYIMGNPPYIGRRNQDKIQKQEIKDVLGFLKNYSSLDYISIWFYKASIFSLGINSRFAFVSTNSIVQGELVYLFWPYILNLKLEIFFAYTSFKWRNNAKGNAGVSVVIIGMRNITKEKKHIFIDKHKKEVKNINAYLADSVDVYIKNRSKPISDLPEMTYGNMPGGCTKLFLSPEEKKVLISSYPELKAYIKKLVGSQESINNIEKYTLWFKDISIHNEILKLREVADKIETTRKTRVSSKDESYNNLQNRPHQFRDLRETSTNSVLIPIVSSENREYIPISIVDSDTIVPNSAQVIYDIDIYIFGIVTSKMHMLWMNAVAGRLEERYRYSKNVVYNTFPFPKMTKQQKEEISECVHEILDERSKHSEKTLAQMYDPDKMPEDLKHAHYQLDLTIEKIYRPKPFENDEERLEYLFKLYKKMIEREQEFINNKKK